MRAPCICWMQIVLQTPFRFSFFFLRARRNRAVCSFHCSSALGWRKIIWSWNEFKGLSPESENSLYVIFRYRYQTDHCAAHTQFRVKSFNHRRAMRYSARLDGRWARESKWTSKNAQHTKESRKYYFRSRGLSCVFSARNVDKRACLWVVTSGGACSMQKFPFSHTSPAPPPSE